MKIKIRKLRNIRIDTIGELILMAGILVGSWMAVFPSYADEIVLGCLIVFTIYKTHQIDSKALVTLIVFAAWCMIGLLVNGHLEFYGIFYIVNNLKPVLFLVFIMELKLRKEQVDRLLKFFMAVNIPSVLVCIYNYVSYNILGGGMLFDSGTLKEVNGVIMLRSGGLAGHSGTMSDISAVLTMLCLCYLFERFTFKRMLLTLFFFTGLICASGRFPLYFTGAVFVVLLVKNVVSKFRKMSRYVFYLIIAAVCIFVSFYAVSYVLETFAVDFDSQIRWAAYRYLWPMAVYVITVGAGIGYFGQTNSYLHNAALYRKFDITIGLSSSWEAHFPLQLIQTGIVGTLLWYSFYLRYARKLWKSAGGFKSVTLVFYAYFLVSSLINVVYGSASPIMLYILMSYQVRAELIENE